MKHLQIVETEHFDYSKIVISVSGTKYFGRELYMLLLDQYHLQMEMAAGDYVLAMTSVGDTKEGFQRLVQALEEIDSKLDEENHSFYISMGRINSDQPSMGIKAEEDSTENGNIEPMRQKFAGLPRLEMVGSRQLYLEHHTGILTYTDQQIDANTAGGVLRIKGERLTLLAMTAGELRVGGHIQSVEWVR